MHRPSTVLFDIDHTLGFDHQLEMTILRRMCDEAAHLPDAVSREVERRAHDEFERARAGLVRVDAAVQDLFLFVSGQCPEARLDAAALTLQFIERVVRECRDFLVVAPGAQTLLQHLDHHGFGTGALTNGWKRLQDEKAAIIGIRGPVFVSDSIGYWKPDARAFHFALEQLGQSPEQVLFVGDSPTSDVRGAKEAGLAVVWVNSDGTEFPADLPRPDDEIRHLDELRARLT